MSVSAKLVMELREKTGLAMMACKKALVEAEGDINLAIENLRKIGAATAAKRSGKATKEGAVVSVADGNFNAIIEINCETEPVSKAEGFVKLVEDVKKAVIAKKPTTLDEVLALDLGGETVQERMTDLIGKIGEKIIISSYFTQTNAANEVTFSYVHSNGKVGSLIKFAVTKDVAGHADVKQLGADVAMQIAAQKPLALDRSGISAEAVAKEKEIVEAQLKNDPKNANKPANILSNIAEGKLGKFFKESTLLDQEFIKNDKISVKQLIEETAKKVDAEITAIAMNLIELGANSVEEEEEE